MMKTAPKYLNLLKIKLPAPGMVSIFHRVSGFLMIIALPLLVWVFGLSISNEAGFAQSQQLLHSATGKLTLALLGWALAHHMLAGIRFLLIDLDLGVSKKSSTFSAYAVNIASIIILITFVGMALS